MTDYTQNVSYGPKDALSTGDAAKRIKGTELDAEFVELATAIASKEDEANKGANNGYCGLGAGGLVDPTDLPAATESAIGAVELATTVEATTGTDTARAVTAAGVKAVVDALKAAPLTLTGGALVIETAMPQIAWRETDAALDEKQWECRVSGGDLFLYTDNDAGSAVGTPFALTRTGTAVDTITFSGTTITLSGTTIALSGNGTVSGTLGITGDVAVNTNKFTVASASGNTLVAGTLTVGAIDITPTEGTFTAYLRATDNGANLASGTASWKKARGIIQLFLPSLTATTGATSPLYIDGLPAAIFPVSSAQYLLAPGYDAGNPTALQVQVGIAGDYLLIYPFNSSTFTAGSTNKGILSTTLTWAL